MRVCSRVRNWKQWQYCQCAYTKSCRCIDKVHCKSFSDIDSGLLDSAKLADLSSWPHTYADAVGRYQISWIYFKKTHTYTHMYVNFHFSYIVSDFGDEFLVTLVDHFRSHLEASVIVVHNVESEWTILKQELYTRWVTLTHSKNGITHLEFNWCIDRLNYQILVYTRTFIFFLAAISIIPWPGRPSIVYTGIDAQTYWMLLIWLCLLLNKREQTIFWWLTVTQSG